MEMQRRRGRTAGTSGVESTSVMARAPGRRPRGLGPKGCAAASRPRSRGCCRSWKRATRRRALAIASLTAQAATRTRSASPAPPVPASRRSPIALIHRPARARRLGGRARGRPVEPTDRRRHPRRSCAHGRARHRSRGVHPLDGDAWHLGGLATATPQAIRVLDATGHAVDPRRDRRRRPGGARHRRRRRHHRRRRQPGLGRRRAGEQGGVARGRRRVRGEQGRSRRCATPR